MSIVDIDPHRLVPHERNLRSDVGDVSDLKASIETVGILQPLVVMPCADDEDAYRIVIGHRRQRAAIELDLPTVPCLVAESEGAAQQIVTMLAENTHRVNLTVTEEANAYAQLALLDWSADQIAKVTAQPVSRVRNAIALTSLPQQAREAADTGALTLKHAADLNEFTDDPKALERILKRGGGAGWTFQHAIAEERRKRDRKTALDRLKAELVLAGVKVIAKPKNWGYGTTTEVRAQDLVDADGNPLDPEEVKTRPGFAAIVHANAYGSPTAEVVCVDPEAWGYTRATSPGRGSTADAAERAAAEAARQAYREALEVAAQVRHKFLRETYGSARGAKKAYPHALRAAVCEPGGLRYTSDHSPLADAIAGIAMFPAAESAGTDRLTRMLVARWVCGNEHNLARLAAGQRWDTNPDAAVTYLDQLVAAGYDLSEAETTLRTGLLPADEDTDDQDTDDEHDEEPDADGEDPASDAPPWDTDDTSRDAEEATVAPAETALDADDLSQEHADLPELVGADA